MTFYYITISTNSFANVGISAQKQGLKMSKSMLENAWNFATSAYRDNEKVTGQNWETAVSGLRENWKDTHWVPDPLLQQVFDVSLENFCAIGGRYEGAGRPFLEHSLFHIVGKTADCRVIEYNFSTFHLLMKVAITVWWSPHLAITKWQRVENWFKSCANTICWLCWRGCHIHHKCTRAKSLTQRMSNL